MIVAVIPARLHSRRLPGKPLLDIAGRPLVEHVWRRVSAAVDHVVVATDAQRVADVVRGFGGEAVITGDHPSGSHRVAAVAETLGASLVLNVQGDQPLLDPAHLRVVVDALRGGAGAATLACPWPDGLDPADASTVKVVRDHDGCAMYFSRAPIPHGGPWLRHIGVYGFTLDTLRICTTLPGADLERSEDLEQLRWLVAGVRVRVEVVRAAVDPVDTPAQLQALRERLG